jgi:hypothetical protein
MRLQDENRARQNCKRICIRTRKFSAWKSCREQVTSPPSLFMSVKRQFAWSMAPMLVISVVNLVSVRLFYRHLGPEMHALWFYVNTLSGVEVLPTQSGR